MDMNDKHHAHQCIDQGLEEALLAQFKKQITETDLSVLRPLIQRTCEQFGINAVDCAAVLASLYLSQQKSFQQEKNNPVNKIRQTDNSSIKSNQCIKMVRYRLEVGRKHRMVIEELKNLLVEEAGVDRKHIGYIDMHYHYTFIKLPDGMPTDIFNHLKTVKINQQVLKIKCVNHYNKQKSRNLNAEKPASNRRQRTIKGQKKNNNRPKTQYQDNTNNVSKNQGK